MSAPFQPRAPSDPPTAAPYPLLLRAVLLEKVWGGRRLEALGKDLPPGKAVGESWELADLAATSASGAGGQSIRSVIAGGPLAGATLHDALGAWGRDLLGDIAPSAGGGFPLLVKFLDASQNLSVQVHPSPAFAAAHPAAHLKTESWYILDADPGAQLYIGLNPGTTGADFARAARAQSRELPAMLRAVPAIPGECHTLASGTVHALGAGITVAEIQTPSDTTFRLYDWGRAGRGLHVDEALECLADPGIEPPARAALPEGELCGRLASTPHYTIDEARPAPGDTLTIGYACKRAASAPFVLMVLEGRARLGHAQGRFEAVDLARGQTVLIPASLARHTVLEAGGNLRVLRVGLCG